jgi:hypothetical protein
MKSNFHPGKPSTQRYPEKQREFSLRAPRKIAHSAPARQGQSSSCNVSHVARLARFRIFRGALKDMAVFRSGNKAKNKLGNLPTSSGMMGRKTRSVADNAPRSRHKRRRSAVSGTARGGRYGAGAVGRVARYLGICNSRPKSYTGANQSRQTIPVYRPSVNLRA